MEAKFYISMVLIFFIALPALLLVCLRCCKEVQKEVQKEEQKLEHTFSKGSLASKTHSILEYAEEELEVLKEELESWEVIIGVKVKILISTFQVRLYTAVAPAPPVRTQSHAFSTASDACSPAWRVLGRRNDRPRRFVSATRCSRLQVSVGTADSSLIEQPSGFQGFMDSVSFTSLNPFNILPVKCITGNDTNYYYRLVVLTGVPLAVIIALELRLRAEMARILLEEAYNSTSTSAIRYCDVVKSSSKQVKSAAKRIKALAKFQFEEQQRKKVQKVNNLVYIQQILLFLVYPACTQVALSTFRCITL